MITLSLMFPVHILISLTMCNGYNVFRGEGLRCLSFICGTDNLPICGSDGHTYLNPCVFLQAQCQNSDLTAVKESSCESVGEVGVTSASSDQMNVCGIKEECTMDNKDPICGSDRVTYFNACYFTVAYCKNRDLRVANKGECSDVDAPVAVTNKCKNVICPFEENAICASNGKTYRNECEFNHANCYIKDLTVLNKGKCEPGREISHTCDWDCDNDNRPTCGTDGHTYQNMCYFERAECKNKDLKIYKFASC